jgi:hypothetical protein
LPALGGRRDARAAGRLRDHLLRRGFHAEAVARVVRELIHVDEENDGAGDGPAGDDAG